MKNKLPEQYDKTYKPLPDGLKILESKIDGQGLFTTKLLPQGKSLGTTHLEVSGLLNIIRTPLGGFINHSDTPNCVIKIFKSDALPSSIVFHGLSTLRVIQPDEELTIDYSKSSCSEKCKYQYGINKK
jgi:SET domain-containing protein